MLIYGLKDNKIKVEIDPDKPIYDQNISDNAISIILEIADKYWYSEKEKQELRNALKGNKNG